MWRVLVFCIQDFCAMSRCFPFPPPGYEKKARTDDADLLKKVNLFFLHLLLFIISKHSFTNSWMSYGCEFHCALYIIRNEPYGFHCHGTLKSLLIFQDLSVLHWVCECYITFHHCFNSISDWLKWQSIISVLI